MLSLFVGGRREPPPSDLRTPIRQSSESRALTGPGLDAGAARRFGIAWPFSLGAGTDKGPVGFEERLVDMAALLGLTQPWPGAEEPFE